MKNMKKLLALGLTAALTITTAVPAFAAEMDFPNLLAVNVETLELSSPPTYNAVLNADTGTDYAYFGVVGASSDYYASAYLTNAQAEGVTWQVLEGSVAGIGEPMAEIIAYDESADQYVSFSTTEVNMKTAADAVATGSIKYGVVEAKNTLGNTADFGIAIDTAGYTNVKNVKNVFYDASGSEEKFLGETTCSTVSGNNYYGNTRYASVMDCPLALIIAPDSVISSYETNPYASITNWDSVDSFTFKNEEIGTLAQQGEGADAIGWNFRVYENGKLIDLSGLVSGDIVSLNDNDTVVWKYGKTNVPFPETIQVD